MLAYTEIPEAFSRSPYPRLLEETKPNKQQDNDKDKDKVKDNLADSLKELSEGLVA